MRWIYDAALYHSSIRDHFEHLGGVRIALYTLVNYLHISSSAQHLYLKDAVCLALEVVNDEHTSRVFEALDSNCTAAEISLANATRIVDITRLR